MQIKGECRIKGQCDQTDPQVCAGLARGVDMCHHWKVTPIKSKTRMLCHLGSERCSERDGTLCAYELSCTIQYPIDSYAERLRWAWPHRIECLTCKETVTWEPPYMIPCQTCRFADYGEYAPGFEEPKPEEPKSQMWVCEKAEGCNFQECKHREQHTIPAVPNGRKCDKNPCGVDWMVKCIPVVEPPTEDWFVLDGSGKMLGCCLTTSQALGTAGRFSGSKIFRWSQGVR
jgi:hypothetical protein